MSISNIYPSSYHPREVQIVIWIFYASAVLTLLEGFWVAAQFARFGYNVGGAIISSMIFAAIDFGAGYFLNTSRSSLAFWVAVVLLVLGFLGSLVSIAASPLASIIGLAISGYALYLLWRPHVKAYYGVGAAAQAIDQTLGQAASALGQAGQGQQPPRCPVCGTPLVYVAQYKRWYCPKCKRYY